MHKQILGFLAVGLIGSTSSISIVRAQSITTLSPSSFAAGQDVSNAFSGLTLWSMSLAPETVAGNPFTVYVPTYGQVYAVGDTFSASSSFATGWGANFGLSCFQGCVGGQGAEVGTNLLIDFNNPVSMVSVFQTGNAFNGVDLQAYNNVNQLVGYCDAAPGGPQSVGSYGCYSVTNGAATQWGVDTSVSANDISKILVGGYNAGGDQVNEIQFARAPEIDRASAANGVLLLFGGLAVLRSRRQSGVSA